MVTELAKGVYWVGVVDWGLRQFHGHELSTHRGSTYNSYLIVDEKTVLVDTVWGPFQDQLIENIRKVVDPAKIDIVVANHSETDHSGSLPAVMRHTPGATVIVSSRGEESVEGHYHAAWKFQKVKTGKGKTSEERFDIRGSPMLHWPDSMVTYLTGVNILMPNDAFGQHYATAFRFNDQVDQEELYEEALKYYANILTPSATWSQKNRGGPVPQAARRHDRAESWHHLEERSSPDRRESTGNGRPRSRRKKLSSCSTPCGKGRGRWPRRWNRACGRRGYP